MYLYILASKGHCHIGTLSTLWFWHNNLSSFQRTAFIFSYINAGWQEEDTFTFWGQKVKGQGHNGSLPTLWDWHNTSNLGSFQCTAFILSYIDAGWQEKGTYTFLGQNVKVTSELCQHFGSDTITWVFFNVQLSYSIHRCRMVRGRYLYILGSKGQRSRSQLNFVNTFFLTRYFE